MGSGVITVERDKKFCTYKLIKIDEEVLLLVRAAAVRAKKTLQEWASDALNIVAAKETEWPPVDRKPPPPKPKGRPRKKK